MFSDDLFDHLTPRGTIDHVLTGVHIPRSNPKPVILTLKFCGRDSAYMNALTKAKPVADDDARQEPAAVLFAKHGVESWRNVEHDGAGVTYTPELGAEVFVKLLKSKADDKLGEAIAVATSRDNFRAPIVEADDLGKG